MVICDYPHEWNTSHTLSWLKSGLIRDSVLCFNSFSWSQQEREKILSVGEFRLPKEQPVPALASANNLFCCSTYTSTHARYANLIWKIMLDSCIYLMQYQKAKKH